MAFTAFERAFRKLMAQSNKYAGVERSVENFDEMAGEWAVLDDRRNEADQARSQVSARTRQPNPEYIPPRQGPFNEGWGAKLGAIVTAALLAFTLFFIANMFKSALGDFPLAVENVTETLDASDGCLWTLTATLHNESSETVSIDYVGTVLTRSSSEQTGASTVVRETMTNRRFVLVEAPTLAPGAEATMVVSSRLFSLPSCPTSPSDIDHGDLNIKLDNQDSVAVEF